jgi:hypothetical protein
MLWSGACSGASIAKVPVIGDDVVRGITHGPCTIELNGVTQGAEVWAVRVTKRRILRHGEERDEQRTQAGKEDKSD